MKRLALVGSVLAVLMLFVSPGLARGMQCGCGAAVAGCDDCDDGVCGAPCGAPCGGCRPCGPIALLVRLLHLGCCCGGGCGEAYWGGCAESVDCCDPCDCAGNYVGRAGPAGPACGAASASAYVKKSMRGPVYASQESVKNEFGLDPSVKIISRSDHVVVPAQANVTASESKPTARQSARPHRAPPRR